MTAKTFNARWLRKRTRYLFILLVTGGANAAEVKFPDGFNWCTATSAHQIEGYNSNSDWWAWERLPGKIKNADKSGAATDHWNRWESDLDLLVKLGIKEYRFSVEWAKIEPRENVYDPQALSHYAKLVEGLRKRGIKPMVTLHHFTFPLWLREKGGWEWDGSIEAFTRFSIVVYETLGSLVEDWITINEPTVHLVTGYLAGAVPPGKSDIQQFEKPLVNLVKAHAGVYHALHNRALAANRLIRVGLAHHLRVFKAKHFWNPLDLLAVRFVDKAFNWALPNTLQSGHLKLNIPFALNIDTEIPEAAGTQDFFGLNYYSRDIVHFTGKAPIGIELTAKEDSEKTEMGWEIYPKGIFDLLMRIKKRTPDLPVIITENGLADKNDSQRISFIKDHLFYVRKAMEKGVNIEGYCYWSLLDNFEWNEGFWPRFGLFEVNYADFSRTPRPSAEWFSRVTHSNEFIWTASEP